MYGPTSATAIGWIGCATALERHPTAHGPTHSVAATTIAIAGTTPATDVGPAPPQPHTRPHTMGPYADAGGPSCVRPYRAQQGQDALDWGPVVLFLERRSSYMYGHSLL
jgi:hypothetical protein